MTENLENEYKQAKGAKPWVNIRSWRAKNSQNILQSTWLERQNMKNETIFELYTDDNKSKYSSNPMNILKSANKKKKNESLHQEMNLNHFYFHFDSP